jgi:exonuclease III
MTDIYKVATLNINGLTSQKGIAMLEDFLIKHEIDILFLQEVTQPLFDNLRGYTAHTNTETTRRGTAILARDHLTLNNIVPLPTGRGVASDFQGVWLVNIYAPSGPKSDKKRRISISTYRICYRPRRTR